MAGLSGARAGGTPTQPQWVPSGWTRTQRLSGHQLNGHLAWVGDFWDPALTRPHCLWVDHFFARGQEAERVTRDIIIKHMGTA